MRLCLGALRATGPTGFHRLRCVMPCVMWNHVLYATEESPTTGGCYVTLPIWRSPKRRLPVTAPSIAMSIGTKLLPDYGQT